ncbi:hypothetical protein SESBI_47046, partial [Sesbania bispinosa]
EGSEEKERSFGPWMKASNFVRRTYTKPEQRRWEKEEDGANPNRRRKPIAKEVLDKLTRLTMKDDGGKEVTKVSPGMHGTPTQP